MEIHKPKPIHSFKEFLKEIGIIVCGVLIALAAEQGVEALHWQHELQGEREALNSEARDFLSSAAFRLAEQPCLIQELHDVRTVLDRHARNAPLGLRRNLNPPIGTTATSGTWQIALAGQALGHMPLKEKLGYSGAFGTYETFNRLSVAETAPWTRLSLLNDAQQMTEADWSTLRQARLDAATATVEVGVLADAIVRKNNLGLKPAAIEDGQVAAALKAACAPLIDR